jgi:hypothetical protein
MPCFSVAVVQIPDRHTLIGHLTSRGFETVASGLVDGVLKVYFYATGSTLAAVGFGSQSVAPTTAFLAEFRFVTSELKLYAKFKCSDDAATATFVRVRAAVYTSCCCNCCCCCCPTALVTTHG